MIYLLTHVISQASPVKVTVLGKYARKPSKPLPSIPPEVVSPHAEQPARQSSAYDGLALDDVNSDLDGPSTAATSSTHIADRVLVTTPERLEAENIKPLSLPSFSNLRLGSFEWQHEMEQENTEPSTLDRDDAAA